MTNLTVGVGFVLGGILAMIFNRPIGRFLARMNAAMWGQLTRRWGFSHDDPPLIGSAQFSVFIAGLAFVALGLFGLIMEFLLFNPN